MTGDVSRASEVNEHSRAWIRLFLEPVPADRTRIETDFLIRQLPRATFGRVLDVCCGLGRHARALAESGYRVTGVDRNAGLLETARAGAPGVTWVAADATDLGFLGETFDAVICMWQSFGVLDESGNRDTLASMAARLRPGGRLVLDIYNRDFFDANAGESDHERDGIRVTDRKRMAGNRLLTELEYSTGERDRFDWEVFAPADIESAAATAGLTCVLQCTHFDERRPPVPSEPRMQCVFEREPRVT